MLQAENVPQEVREEWATWLQAERVVADDTFTDRLFAEGPGQRTVILMRPVGPDYASAYRGWVTLRRADRMAALAGRPAGYRVVYAMIGLAPDGRIWWSGLYEEAALPVGEAESMGGDRFFRLRPEQVVAAIVMPVTDHLNLGLWPAILPTDEEGAPQAIKAIEAPIGSRISMRGTVVKHNAGGSVTVDFGAIKWAIVGVTPVTVEG